jgi:hypothetical protein
MSGRGFGQQAIKECLPMIIGIDYDGTIANTSEVKAHWIREHLGKEVPPWKTDRTSCVPLIGLEDYEMMSRYVYGREGSLMAGEVLGSIDAIEELAHHSQIFIVTARKPPQIRWCKEWLRVKGLDTSIDGYLSTAGKDPDGSGVTKPKLCRDHGIALLVDDDQRHFEGMEVTNLKRILLKSGCQEAVAVPTGVELARSWQDVLRIVRDELFPH